MAWDFVHHGIRQPKEPWQREKSFLDERDAAVSWLLGSMLPSLPVGLKVICRGGKQHVHVRIWEERLSSEPQERRQRFIKGPDGQSSFIDDDDKYA